MRFGSITAGKDASAIFIVLLALTYDSLGATTNSVLPCAAVIESNIYACFVGLLCVNSKEDEPIDGDQASEVLTDLPSWSWWTARVLLTNQRLLTRSAATLRSALSMLLPQVCNWLNLEHSLDAC